jgi:transcriptional regulator with XRE-family HTH domain
MLTGFGDYLKGKREQHGLDQASLAIKSHMEPSTISRIENDSTDVSIATIVRLCEALLVTPKQIYTQFLGCEAINKGTKINLKDEPDYFSFAFFYNQKYHPIEIEEIINDSDIKGFLKLYDENQYSSIEILCNYLTKTSKLINGKNSFKYSPESFENFYADSKFESLEIEYPDLPPSLVLFVHKNNGIIIPKDVGKFIKGFRTEGKLRLSDLAEITGLSTSTLDRIELGRGIGKIKLVDILQLDKGLQANGELFSMLWKANSFFNNYGEPYVIKLEDDDENIYRRIKTLYLLITMSRWWITITNHNVDIIKNFRLDVKTLI